MNYELAKDLRNAGFPIHDYDGEGGDHYLCHCGSDCSEQCYPILSELIEAVEPYKADEFCLCLNGDTWEAILSYHGYFDYPAKFKDAKGFAAVDLKEEGSTPEEAVARLWLALNKK